MDLPELLARAGIQPDDVAELLTWARARSSALLAGLDPHSPLGQALAPGLAQLVMRRDDPGSAAVPPPPPVASFTADGPIPELAPRRESRSSARAISRPFLGAAVEAALHGEASGNLPPESAGAPAPTPAQLDDDASIGGFTRLAFSVRRQTPPIHERPTEERASLSHGFALHSEREANNFDDVPAPPSFSPSDSMRMRIPNILGDSERSTSLVVGIPDDEAADVPVVRPRAGSGHEASASGSARRPPSAPMASRSQEASIELNLEIEDPDLSSALLKMIPASGETSTMIAADLSSALRRAIPEPMEPSLQITVDEPSALAAAPHPETLAAAEAEAEAEPELEDSRPGPPASPPPRRGSRPPPPPPRRNTPVAAAAPQPEPAPEPAPAKPRKGRKKVLDLSTPVQRNTTRSTPEPVVARPVREPAKPEPSKTVLPNYLRDDDE